MLLWDQNDFQWFNQRWPYSKRVRDDLFHTRKVLSAFCLCFSFFSFIASWFFCNSHGATIRVCTGFILRVANRSWLFSTVATHLKEKSPSNGGNKEKQSKKTSNSCFVVSWIIADSLCAKQSKIKSPKSVLKSEAPQLASLSCHELTMTTIKHCVSRISFDPDSFLE